jgi:tetratricopeptide (TPR) repeat protein
MECRKGFTWVALGLGGLVAGCQHQETTLSPGAVPPGAVVQKEPVEKAKKTPKTETLVKFGDFRLKEAAGAQHTSTERDMLVEEARKSYQEALKLNSKYGPAYQGLGRFYVATDQYGKAVATLQKGVKVTPKDASIWFDLGLCYNHLQQWNKALEALGKAADLDPENPTYANAQGILLARVGRYKESLDRFSRVSGPALASYKLGCTLQHLNQPELSRQYLEAAVQKNPQLGQAQALLAEMNAAESQNAIRTVGYEEPAPSHP